MKIPELAKTVLGVIIIAAIALFGFFYEPGRSDEKTLSQSSQQMSQQDPGLESPSQVERDTWRDPG
ncbi:hypothetical protein [Dongshaea marina]|uniref:hypothetical protein n=1 Tax=Dongshaea marina TaxID=2047966 RepID=UPI000D3E55D5|nr:hypothetical protein [Dongshaea marina]